MNPHPVQLRVPRCDATRERIPIAIRLILLAALGAARCSSVCSVLYLALPALAAVRIVQHGAGRYLAEDGPRVVRVLRWFAGAYAYMWLLTDRWPASDEPDAVDFSVHTEGSPTAGSALLRIVFSLPAVLLLAILSLAGSVLWVIGLVWILVRRRVPPAIAEFLNLTLRFQLRLLAYHLSLVERYPSVEGPAVRQPATAAIL